MLGPFIFGPTADDIDWGPPNMLSTFLLSGWALNATDALVLVGRMPIKRTNLNLSQE
jgi:hypothetical protein